MFKLVKGIRFGGKRINFERKIADRGTDNEREIGGGEKCVLYGANG